MVKAIVYTSNTGYTAEYARLLGEETGLPVFSLDEAGKELDKKTEVIYLGWLMASNVKNYKIAVKNFTVCAICGVGMMGTGEKIEEIRKVSGIAEDMPLFSLQGGFDINKLRGIYKLMMKIMAKSIVKETMAKPEKTQADLELVELMQHGGNHVKRENLRAVLMWYKMQ